MLFIGLCITGAVALSLGDLVGLDAWGWFDRLGLDALPKGLWLILFCVIGGAAYLMDRKRDD
jgi:hypothetical protein